MNAELIASELGKVMSILRSKSLGMFSSTIETDVFGLSELVKEEDYRGEKIWAVYSVLITDNEKIAEDYHREVSEITSKWSE